MTCKRRDAPGPAGGGEHAAPAGDPTLLLDGVEQDERGVRDADDRGQRRLVRVVDHDGAGLGVDPLTQPGGVTGQRQRPGGAGLARSGGGRAAARQPSATATAPRSAATR